MTAHVSFSADFVLDGRRKAIPKGYKYPDTLLSCCGQRLLAKSKDNIINEIMATSPLREHIRTFKQWLAEMNEDPQGPFSKNKKIEEMSPSELEQESRFLESRLRSIYTEKLIANNRWEMGMEDFRLYALRNKASGLLSTGFTIGDGPSSEEVMRKRLNR
ncbi:hypothetical protein TSTA_108440 [Talaromyces stipitatus ATCC 10500]|uniref:Uncharacterized protein n=1 Tax=Talaromyces stipitatus (strain ATCC 10500 / CBS 375.48 / QM 6759 / NRRL 1006) TaxID=441959 RepID=B8MUJ0_TALSN|nr:uncharacterized protein TSTA_108440 [Talaromyces stipitatus ATCC 10500]EED11658.1 hypothetical protein TSTA_108440 [Talaromyces stipitatus ATCC 10500]